MVPNLDCEYSPHPESPSSALTVIIVLRTNALYDMVSRLQYRRADSTSPEVRFLVVDDGSSPDDAVRIRDSCGAHRFDYLRLETAESPFCASRARNYGAMYAQTEFIVHEDIDLAGFDGYYATLLDEIDIQRLREDHRDFITVPVYYLSATGTGHFFETPERRRHKVLLHHHFEGREDLFDFYMPASSVLLISRYHFLSIGGYNEQFKQWGLEDLEYIYRCLKTANKFIPAEKPNSLYTHPPFGEETRYRGWRAMFRLHGDQASLSGLALFHVHHPTDPSWRSGKAHSRNKNLFDRCTGRFDREGHYLPPLPDIHRGRSLIFGKGCFVYNRGFLPSLGIVRIRGYEHFSTSSIADYLVQNRIDRVVFTNPYANEARLRVYREVRAAGIPYYVVERGALRDSLFVDPSGFCAESDRYREDLWNKPLTADRLREATEYINDERSRDDSLEEQPGLLGPRETLTKLGLSADSKILFVPLQSRSDTTIRYFAGPVETYDNFLDLVRNVVTRLDPEWTVLVKHHPLSKVREDIPEAIIVDDYNVKDLLEVSTSIMLINSGVGVLAALYERPVVIAGQAFYRSDLLNRSAHTGETAAQAIMSGFRPSQEHCRRFISYLIHEFYSFGNMTVQKSNYTDEANMTVTEEFDCYEARIDRQLLLRYPARPEGPRVPAHASAYDRVRWYLSVYTTAKRPQRDTVHHRPEETAFKRKLRKLKRDPRGFFADAVRNRLPSQ